MKKRYVILLLVTQTLLFGAAWIYFAWRIEHVEHIKSYVRFFQSAVQVYAMDSVIAKREPMFPATLADLQKERYLDSSDIYKIQKFIPDFQYKPPKKIEAPFDIVFTGQFFDYRMECPVFGNVHYTKQ
jgi:hypothetical protein